MQPLDLVLLVAVVGFVVHGLVAGLTTQLPALVGLVAGIALGIGLAPAVAGLSADLAVQAFVVLAVVLLSRGVVNPRVLASNLAFLFAGVLCSWLIAPEKALAGTAVFRHIRVLSATSSTLACSGQSLPGTTIEAFRIVPSSITLWLYRASNSERSTTSVTS